MEDKTRRTTHDTTEQGSPPLDADTHLVRACASEMHLDMSQETLYTEICRENARAQRVQNADTHFVRACAVKMHLHISQEQLYKKIRVKMPEPRMRTHTLCEPAQSKCTLAFHKSHSIKKFTGKMPGPRVSQERGHTFCEACAGEMHLDMS